MEQTVTMSFDIDKLTLGQLLQVANAMTRQAEELRTQRLYLKGIIDARLAAGEREDAEPAPVSSEPVDAVAEGVVLEATPSGVSN